jgi:D-amino peptidase
VAGVVSFETQAYSTGQYYEYAKKLLTAEVNAAIDGLVEAGINDILVNDGHGPGAISFEDLHPKAKLQHGRPAPSRKIMREIVQEYDVCMMLGQHAMAGIQTGNLNHTQNSRGVDYYKLNGEKIGEIAQFALDKGALGLPMIFLSGDDDACIEAQELLPELTVVSVKRGLGRGCAISLSAKEARKRIREGVVTAVKKHQNNPLKPLVIPGPYIMEKRFFYTDMADNSECDPRAERINSQTLRYCSDDILKIIYV